LLAERYLQKSLQVFARGFMNANIFCTRVELLQKYSQEKKNRLIFYLTFT
jgi:hypothetical protein